MKDVWKSLCVFSFQPTGEGADIPLHLGTADSSYFKGEHCNWYAIMNVLWDRILLDSETRTEIVASQPICLNYNMRESFFNCW